MTQTVTVLSTDGLRARVFYDRPTACHQDCSTCAGGCGAMAPKERIIVAAENAIGAAPGDRVTIEAETKAVYGAILLVYALPLALFFLGYFLGAALGFGGTIPGIAGFVLGLAAAVLVSRRKTRTGREISYRITGYAK